MTRTHRMGPWVAVVVGALVAALSIAAALLLEHSVNDQNNAQLQSETLQVSTLAQSLVASIGPQLQSIDAVAQATGNSPTAFASEIQRLYPKGGAPMIAVVRNGTVVLSTGTGFTTGQLLPPSLSSALSGTNSGLFSPGVVNVGGKPVVVLAVGNGTQGDSVFQEVSVFPKPIPSLAATYHFSNLNIAIYANRTAQPSQLFLTTAKPLPFPGPLAKTLVPVGSSSKWLVETSATTPLAGAWPNAFPWVLLVAGIMLAIVLAVLVNVMGRRERYAQELVAERTAELETVQAEIVHKERLSAVGEMATMIGHELRNPLGAAINGLYLVRHHLGDHVEPPVAKGLDLAERETHRAAALADDLTAYMRERRPSLEQIELGTAIDEVLEATPPPDGVDVQVENRSQAIDADSAQLTQMLSNCVTNAYQAMPDGGSVHVGATAVDGRVEIVIEDTGTGFDGKAEMRAFDPFFTTKAQGTGLGLAIVQRMAEGHGGSVALENREEGGARVTIRLPKDGASTEARA